MAVLRLLYQLLAAAALLNLTLAHPAAEPKTEERETAEKFKLWLQTVPIESLHGALHALHPDFKDGIFSNDRSAAEAVHQTNRPLATQLVKTAKMDLVKRQYNGSSSPSQSVYSPPTSTPGYTPPTSTYTPPTTYQSASSTYTPPTTYSSPASTTSTYVPSTVPTYPEAPAPSGSSSTTSYRAPPSSSPTASTYAPGGGGGGNGGGNGGGGNYPPAGTTSSVAIIYPHPIYTTNAQGKTHTTYSYSTTVVPGSPSQPSYMPGSGSGGGTGSGGGSGSGSGGSGNGNGGGAGGGGGQGSGNGGGTVYTRTNGAGQVYTTTVYPKGGYVSTTLVKTATVNGQQQVVTSIALVAPTPEPSAAADGTPTGSNAGLQSGSWAAPGILAKGKLGAVVGMAGLVGGALL